MLSREGAHVIIGSSRQAKEHPVNLAILFILIGLAVGLLASLLRREGRFGVLGDLPMGVLGALVVGYLLHFARFADVGLFGTMVGAGLGAALLVLDLRLLRRSFAEQVLRSLIWRRHPPMFRGSLPPKQSEPGCEICSVCGQKHLSQRPRA